MIKIENLSKRFGEVRALKDLSLEVERGAVYGFLGQNGAGKTTTLRILSGLARPDSGKIWILDQEVGLGRADVRAQIGVLPEEPAFYPWMTPREYLARFIAPLHGLAGRAAEQRASELLALTGLERAADRRIGGFSRGMRQRLGLAQALVHKPQVLLLDEPVSALDPAGRKEVLELIGDLRGETTILLSTHILADVERVCDTIGVIDRGRLLVQAHRDELLARYATPLLEVETGNGLDRFSEAAQRLPVVQSLSEEAGRCRLLVADVNRASIELMRLLAELALPVRRFEVVQPSLEDVFMQLTERADVKEEA